LEQVVTIGLSGAYNLTLQKDSNQNPIKPTPKIMKFLLDVNKGPRNNFTNFQLNWTRNKIPRATGPSGG